MASDGAIRRTADRIISGPLKPEARILFLVQELELSGSCTWRRTIPCNQFVLEESFRRTIRAEVQPIPRTGDAARLFFTRPSSPSSFRRQGRSQTLMKRIAGLPRPDLESGSGRDLIPTEVQSAKRRHQSCRYSPTTGPRGHVTSWFAHCNDRRRQQNAGNSGDAIGSDENAHSAGSRYPSMSARHTPAEDVATLLQDP